MGKYFYSNCLFEALKMKFKDWNNIKIIKLKRDSVHLFPHFLWYDKLDGNVYDFADAKTIPMYFDEFWWKGRIRIRPLSVYNRWVSKFDPTSIINDEGIMNYANDN